ncbi:MAG: PilW family protein [Burkholderiales bacterium]|nr:MAG: PilW family protein [Burkholderiales bacterium]
MINSVFRRRPVPAQAARPAAARQRGVSMLELLIGLALGLVVVAVITSFFGPASDHRRQLENSGQMFDNATFAAELLSDEIRAAGFFGELQSSTVTWQLADPCALTPTALGWAASPPAAPLPLVGITSGEATPGCIADRRAGTSMLALRRLDFAPVAAASLPAGVHMQVSTCRSDPVDKPFVVGTSAAAMDLRLRNCTDVAPARRVLVRTYFVECPGDCGAGAVPRLTRAELTAAGTIALTPLVDGIENLQFEYGFDTDNDGQPDVYRTALSGLAGTADNDWSNVVAVRLFIVARSRDTVLGHVDAVTFDLGLNGTLAAAGDGYKRHIHTTLVRVMNVAGWRELP